MSGEGELKMDASNSVPVLRGRLTGQMLVLLEKQGTGIKIETAQEIIKMVLEFSPWFLKQGALILLIGSR